MREIPLVGRRVPGLRLLLGAPDLPVNQPLDLVGRPADLVLVPVGVGVGDGDVAAVDVGGNALEVVVGLGGLELGADELVVDFVFDVGHQNKSGDDAGAARGLEARFHGAVPHVRRRG